MGILDGLFSPQMYSGAGGLLSRLSPSLGMLPPSQGFDESSPLDNAQWPQGPVGAPSAAGPIAVGNYQMPRMGDSAQYTPDPAALPVNAQPAQGQLPQQPSGFGGFLQNLKENFQSMGNGGSLIGALTGQSPSNHTAQFLVSKGIDPGMARTIASDPSLLRTILPQITGLTRGQQPAKVQEYLFAKQEDPTLTYAKFLQKERSTNEYGMNPLYATNAKGETEAWQLGKDGKPVKVELPSGSTIARGIETIQTPTEVITRDKQSGVILGREKKDLQGKEAAEERGKAQGQAQAKIPAALIDAEETTKKIDDLLKSEGLDSIVGSVDQYRPSWTLGDSGRKALSQLEQLQGGAFLQAFNTLKGGGAITEIEGQKAERAIARMQRYQSENDFREALMDFRDAVKTGVRKLQAAANSGGAPVAPVEAPKRIKLNADGTIAQ